MRRDAWILFLLLSATAMTATAQAQHARFVLFGDPNPEASRVSAQEKFVHPITAPYTHENAMITSDVRAWYIYHDFPSASAIDGGRANAVAVQVRLALTDRLQFVAYKDGYIDLASGLVDDSGLIDLAAGLKFAVYQDFDTQTHFAIGAGYEFGIGDDEVLQDDEEFRLWASFDKGFDKLHLGANVNVYFGDDDDGDAFGDSDHLSWHLHADYYLLEWFSPVIELNGYYVFSEGDVVLPFQGVDLLNLGGVKDEYAMTIGLGGEFRINEQWSVRAAYETPILDAQDLFGYRWTVSAVFSF